MGSGCTKIRRPAEAEPQPQFQPLPEYPQDRSISFADEYKRAVAGDDVEAMLVFLKEMALVDDANKVIMYIDYLRFCYYLGSDVSSHFRHNITNLISCAIKLKRKQCCAWLISQFYQQYHISQYQFNQQFHALIVNNDSISLRALLDTHDKLDASGNIKEPHQLLRNLSLQKGYVHLALHTTNDELFSWLTKQFPCDIRDKEGRTPGYLAAKKGELPKLKAVMKKMGFLHEDNVTIINKGAANQYLTNGKKEHALVAATESGHTTCAKWLAEQLGVDFRSDRDIPLGYTAVASKQFELLEFFFELKGFPTKDAPIEPSVLKAMNDFLTCGSGLHAIHNLIQDGDEARCLRFISKLGIAPSENVCRYPYHAARSGNTTLLKKILYQQGWLDARYMLIEEYRAQANQHLKSGEKHAIFNAICRDHTETAIWLVQQFGLHWTFEGGTPEYFAVKQNNLPLLKRLLTLRGLMEEGTDEIIPANQQSILNLLKREDGCYAWQYTDSIIQKPTATWLVEQLHCDDEKLNGASMGYFAACSGNRELLIELLRRKGYLTREKKIIPAKIDAVNEYLTNDQQGIHAMHMVAKLARSSVLEWLYPQIGFDQLDARGYMPWAYAIARGQFKTFKQLLAWKGYVDPDTDEIIIAQEAEVLKYLTCQNKSSAGHLAALYDQVDIFSWLFKQLSCTQRDASGRTPGFIAAKYGSNQVLEYIMDNERFCRKADDRSALNRYFTDASQHHAAHFAAVNGHRDTLAFLERRYFYHQLRGIKDKDGLTPCYYAIKGGHLEALKYLLTYSTNVNEHLTFQDGALHAIQVAAEYGHINCIEWLLSNVDCKRYLFDVSPSVANIAWRNNHLDALLLILQHFRLVDETGNIRAEDLDQVIGLLRSDTHPLHPINAAAVYGHIEGYEWLSKQLPSAVKDETYSRTSAYLAAEKGHFELLIHIMRAEGYLDGEGNIQPGSLPEARQDLTDNRGCHVALLAAKNGHSQVLEWLIAQFGTDLSDQSGYTLPFYAAESHRLDILKLILSARNLLDDGEMINHDKIGEAIEYLTITNPQETDLDVSNYHVIHHLAYCSPEIEDTTLLKWLTDNFGCDQRTEMRHHSPGKYALFSGNLEFLQHLLSANGWLDAPKNVLSGNLSKVADYLAETPNTPPVHLISRTTLGTDCFSWLLDQFGCELTSDDGRTVGSHTIQAGRLDALKIFFIKKGFIDKADPTSAIIDGKQTEASLALCDAEGNHAIRYAVERGYLDIYLWLTKRFGYHYQISGDLTLAAIAAKNGHFALLKEILKNSEHLDDKGNLQSVRQAQVLSELRTDTTGNAVFDALFGNHFSTFEWLVEQFDNEIIRGLTFNGNSLIRVCILSGQFHYYAFVANKLGYLDSLYLVNHPLDTKVLVPENWFDQLQESSAYQVPSYDFLYQLVSAGISLDTISGALMQTALSSDATDMSQQLSTHLEKLQSLFAALESSEGQSPTLTLASRVSDDKPSVLEQIISAGDSERLNLQIAAGDCIPKPSESLGAFVQQAVTSDTSTQLNVLYNTWIGYYAQRLLWDLQISPQYSGQLKAHLDGFISCIGHAKAEDFPGQYLPEVMNLLHELKMQYEQFEDSSGPSHTLAPLLEVLDAEIERNRPPTPTAARGDISVLVDGEKSPQPFTPKFDHEAHSPPVASASAESHPDTSTAATAPKTRPIVCPVSGAAAAGTGLR